MKLLLSLTIFLHLSVTTLFGQTRVIPITSDGFESKVSIYVKNPTVKVNLKKTYAWYVSKEVKETVGGYEGVLLHGKYVSFFDNKQLREEGQYSVGLKNGLWKQWYSNGQLKQTASWSNGYLNGPLKKFNETGELIAIENYRSNLKHGLQQTWENGKSVELRFKKGELVPAKVPKEKKAKIDSPEKVVRFKAKEEKPADSQEKTKKKEKKQKKEKKEKKKENPDESKSAQG